MEARTMKRRKRNRESGPSASDAEAVSAASWVYDRELSSSERVVKEQSESELTSGAGAVEIPSWLRDQELPPQIHGDQAGPNSEVGLGVVNIPAADGYHFADDHPWGAKQQAALVTSLADLEEDIRRA
jgi:hypothetical protein